MARGLLSAAADDLWKQRPYPALLPVVHLLDMLVEPESSEPSV